MINSQDVKNGANCMDGKLYFVIEFCTLNPERVIPLCVLN